MFFTYEELDKSFEEYIRLAVVAAGYYPDEVSFLGNTAGFKAAKTAITTSGKELIEVRGLGSPDSRDGLTINRFTVNRAPAHRGTIGGHSPYFKLVSGSGSSSVFDKRLYPATSKNITYTIRILSNRTSYRRIMENILENVFETFGFMSVVNVNTGAFIPSRKFFVVAGNTADLSSKDFIELMYMYTVRDVFVTEGKIIHANIPTLKNVGGFIGPRSDIAFPDPAQFQVGDLVIGAGGDVWQTEDGQTIITEGGDEIIT